MFLPLVAAVKADELAERFRTAAPFKHAVIDDFFPPEACRRLSQEFPAFDRPVDPGAWRHPVKGRHEKIAALGPAFAELDRLFQSPELSALLSRITGIPDLSCDPEYVGGGTHELREGAEQDPRTDYTLHPVSGLHRRVRLLLSLDADWSENWGGALELHRDPWRGQGLEPSWTIAPRLNRCVVLETTNRSWTALKPVRLPPAQKGRSLRRIEAFFYTSAAPLGFLPVPSDLDASVARPFPSELKPGRVLTEEDVALIARRIAERDWKLEYLYGRAIGLFNQERLLKAELARIRTPSAGASSPGSGT